MSIFIPDMYIPHYNQCDLEKLRSRGITALLIDLDNTVVSHTETALSIESLQFISRIQEADIIPIFISNNRKYRVHQFATQAQIDAYSFSCKPLKRNYKKVLRKLRIPAEKVAVLGDQLVTDVMGGNRMKMITILQDPLENKENTAGKVTRKIERQIYETLEKKGKLRRGVYYDHL